MNHIKIVTKRLQVNSAIVEVRPNGVFDIDEIKRLAERMTLGMGVFEMFDVIDTSSNDMPIENESHTEIYIQDGDKEVKIMEFKDEE